MGAVVLEIMSMTVLRPNKELRLAQWPEVDWENKILNIPAWRMKTKKLKELGKPFRVPLVDRVMELLRRLREQANGSPYIFTGYSQEPLAERTMNRLLRDTMGLSKDEATVHGLRSTFRTWVAETDFDQLAAEICLSHVVGDKSVQAYLRSDMLEKRRQIMTAWSDYCNLGGPYSVATAL